MQAGLTMIKREQSNLCVAEVAEVNSSNIQALAVVCLPPLWETQTLTFSEAAAVVTRADGEGGLSNSGTHKPTHAIPQLRGSL